MLHYEAMIVCYPWLSGFDRVFIQETTIGSEHWEFMLVSDDENPVFEVNNITQTSAGALTLVWIPADISHEDADETARQFMLKYGSRVIQIGFTPYRKFLSLFDYYFEPEDVQKVIDSGNNHIIESSDVFMFQGSLLTNNENIDLHIRMICQQTH